MLLLFISCCCCWLPKPVGGFTQAFAAIASRRNRRKNVHSDSFKILAAASSWTDTFLDYFQGDFDNYNQVHQDRNQGMLPREGGGHEHLHCTLLPLCQTARLASFSFDANPNMIFRMRYYRCVPVYDNDTIVAMEMYLYTLSPSLEGALRRASDTPLSWPSLIVKAVGSLDFETLLKTESIQLLPKCEVVWSLNATGLEYSTPMEGGLHAFMKHGSAVVQSQNFVGQLLIKDQLSLYQNVFYIHDRGYNVETKEMVYGNHRNVPYILERVADILHPHGSGESLLRRNIVNTDLEWTLGPSYRSVGEYASKLNAVMGPSVSSS